MPEETEFDPRKLRAGDIIDDDPGGDYWLISFCREVYSDGVWIDRLTRPKVYTFGKTAGVMRAHILPNHGCKICFSSSYWKEWRVKRWRIIGNVPALCSGKDVEVIL